MESRPAFFLGEGGGGGLRGCHCVKKSRGGGGYMGSERCLHFFSMRAGMLFVVVLVGMRSGPSCLRCRYTVHVPTFLIKWNGGMHLCFLLPQPGAVVHCLGARDNGVESNLRSTDHVLCFCGQTLMWCCS